MLFSHFANKRIRKIRFFRLVDLNEYEMMLLLISRPDGTDLGKLEPERCVSLE